MRKYFALYENKTEFWMRLVELQSTVHCVLDQLSCCIAVNLLSDATLHLQMFVINTYNKLKYLQWQRKQQQSQQPLV